jgi:hypothetical protein
MGFAHIFMGFAQLFTGFADEPRQLSGASRRKKNALTLHALRPTLDWIADEAGPLCGASRRKKITTPRR